MSKPIQIACNNTYVFLLYENGQVWRYQIAYPDSNPKLIGNSNL